MYFILPSHWIHRRFICIVPTVVRCIFLSADNETTALYNQKHSVIQQSITLYPDYFVFRLIKDATCTVPTSYLGHYCNLDVSEIDNIKTTR